MQIEKDGELERMTTEMSELHKSKRQLMELLEQKDSEISEKNANIKSYLEKIVSEAASITLLLIKEGLICYYVYQVKLTDASSEKESRFAEASAELARSQAMCFRLSQEKELMERHTKWLDEELTSKVDSYAELRRRHSDLEAEMSAKLVDVRLISVAYSSASVLCFSEIQFLVT